MAKVFYKDPLDPLKILFLEMKQEFYRLKPDATEQDFEDFIKDYVLPLVNIKGNE